VLLEPIIKVEVGTPEDYTGSVIGDLNLRRGQIQGQELRGDASVINTMVPLANMFGYLNTLGSSSQGRATPKAQFSHDAPVPFPLTTTDSRLRWQCVSSDVGLGNLKPLTVNRRQPKARLPQRIINIHHHCGLQTGVANSTWRTLLSRTRRREKNRISPKFP
jgi:translation elongation factor EF-G